MKQQSNGVTEHLKMVEMLVEGLGGMEMIFGWDLMAEEWSGIGFMTQIDNFKLSVIT